MKKLFALILALLLLCSCGVQEEPVIDEPQQEIENSQSEPEIKEESSAGEEPKKEPLEEDYAKDIYESKEHEEYLLKISERIESYKNGTFEPVENHHSAYPEDFPSLAKAESAGEECVALAWRNSVYSGNVTYEGAMDYIVAIDKTHAIILEPAQFIGDWGTSYGFANTGYIDAEKARYQSVYDWMKDIYDGYYSGIKLIAGLGVAEKGTPLTEEEVAKVSKAFEHSVLKDGIAYANLPAVFLQSTFERPEEMDAIPLLYYFPSEMLITDEAEFEDLKALWNLKGRGYREGAKIENHPVPLHKIPKSMVEEAVRKYLGIELTDLKNSDLETLAENGIDYMEKYDCFYSEASDGHGGGFTCESGEIYPDGTVILQGRGNLVLKKHADGSYKFYSYCEIS